MDRVPAGPIVRALFRSVCRKESGSYNSRAPRTTPAKCGSRRRNGSSRSSTWEGTKAARTTVFSTNRPAGFDPAETAGNENGRYIVTRTLVRGGADEPYREEFRTFAISELSDSLLILQDTKPMPRPSSGENGRPLKRLRPVPTRLRTGEPDNGAGPVGYGPCLKRIFITCPTTGKPETCPERITENGQTAVAGPHRASTRLLPDFAVVFRPETAETSPTDRLAPRRGSEPATSGLSCKDSKR